MKHLLIDGGYLSFLLASNEYVYNDYIAGKIYQDVFWLLDGKNNIRRDNGVYKTSRDDNTPQRERVRELRQRVRLTAQYEVLERGEADDLIAIMHHAYPDSQFYTLANDKDMLQIPRNHLLSVDYKTKKVKRTTLETFSTKKTLPIAIKDKLTTSARFLLWQACMGDKVDTVAPILPKIGNRFDYSSLLDAFESKTPYTDMYKAFGKAFIDNLMLVILPHPVFLNQVSDLELVEILDLWYTSNISWVNAIGIKDEILQVAEYVYRATEIKPIVLNDFQKMWAKQLGTDNNDIVKTLLDYIEEQT